MENRTVTIVLLVGIAVAASLLLPAATQVRLPGNHQGFEPVQPIAYSHRLHAGELNIPCLYCHSGAEKSRHAGIPAARTCMNCHSVITAPRSQVRAEEELAKTEGREPRPVISPELARLYLALGLGDDLQRDPTLTPRPIEWVRIHQLPDFTYFDHSAHVAAGMECQTCHGPVETMERVRQVESLSMGWCVGCHRAEPGTVTAAMNIKGSSDCGTCHY